jgi:DNA repair ATPase RecN
MEGAAQPKPAAPRITRSGSLAAANIKSPVHQNGAKDSQLKEKQRAPTPAESNDVAPPTARKAFSTSINTLQPIVEALNKILDGDGSTVDTIRWIFGYIREMEKAEEQREESPGSQEKVSDLHKIFCEDIQNVCNYLANRLHGIENMVNATLESSEKALKVAEELKEKSTEIISSVGKVTNATVKIADTTQSYREVLMSRPSPSNKASVDPKVLCDMERKDKQILIDIFDEEGTNTMGISLTELIKGEWGTG